MTPLILTRDRVVSARDGAEWARVWRGNALQTPIPQSQGRLITWSGWMGEGGHPERDLFPRSFETWSRAGWERLASAVDAASAAAARAGGRLLLRPHARHVLSDAHACAAFLASRRAVGLLLDPASMLTPAMIAAAEDHLARTIGALAGHEATAAIVVASVEPSEDPEQLRLCPVGRGLVDAGVWAGLLRGVEVPILLIGEDAHAQAAALGLT